MGYDLAIIAQEQIEQQQSIGELRHALSEAVRRLGAAEQEIATLKAAHAAHAVHVCEGCTTVTPMPVWQGVP